MNNTINIDRAALETIAANLRLVIESIEHLLEQCPCPDCASQDYFDD